MVNKTLTLTIVIPAYNEERYLNSCLDSISRQAVLPNEVIVVDNNSTDNTAKIASSYSFVKLKSAKKQGVAYARDAGFNAAKSDVIARIDADTILPADWVNHVIKFYTDGSNQNTVWTGSGHFYDIQLPRLWGLIYRIIYFYINRFLLRHNTLWGSNMALTREQWQKVSAMTCSRRDIHEDLDLSQHLARLGYKIYVDKNMKVGASLQIGASGPAALWRQLMLWPNTLRHHKQASWVLVWFIGGLVLFCLSPIFLATARPQARKPAWA